MISYIARCTTGFDFDKLPACPHAETRSARIANNSCTAAGCDKPEVSGAERCAPQSRNQVGASL